MSFTSKPILASKSFRKIYSNERLDRYRQMSDCPDNDQLTGEHISRGGKQTFLDTTQKDMDDIYNAFMKVYENREQLSQI